MQKIAIKCVDTFGAIYGYTLKKPAVQRNPKQEEIQADCYITHIMNELLYKKRNVKNAK